MSDNERNPSGDEMPHDEALRDLYRSLPADEPRAELDDAIVAAAKRLAEVRRSRQIVRRLRWAVPLAAAAGLVLTLTLTRLTPQQVTTGTSFRSVESDAPPVAVPQEAFSATQAAPPAKTEAVPQEHAERASEAAREQPRAVAREKNSEARRPADHALAKNHAQTQRLAEAQPRELAPAAPPVVPPAAPAAVPPPAARAAQPAVPPALAARKAAPGAPASEGSAALLQQAPTPREHDRSAPDRAGANEAAGLRASDEEDSWPFALQAGLSAEETCRRVRTVLKHSCRFHEGVALVPVSPPARIDRGSDKGKNVSHLKLTLRDGRLSKVILRVLSQNGTTEDIVLTAQPLP